MTRSPKSGSPEPDRERPGTPGLASNASPVPGGGGGSEGSRAGGPGAGDADARDHDDDVPLEFQQTQATDAPVRDIPIHVHIAGYDQLEELHRGGQGIVYRARQVSTKRTVAIKVLREGAHADATARKRFKREVEIVAQLDHPNIVSVFDSGLTEDYHPFFVMEYVRGRELDQHVRESGLGVRETLELYRVILEAVHHAHQKGVVHRDLKPSNILVDREGHPKLVDFGLARAQHGPMESVASLTGQVLGTVAYMSPEQVRGRHEEIDARADVYALGVILFEILTGRSPYPQTTQIMEMLHHITETPPSLPSRVWSDDGVRRRSLDERVAAGRCPIDTDLETIVLKAIAKEPERRYADAMQFSADLGRYLEGEPIAARRDSGLYIVRKKIERNRRSLVWSAVTALVLGAVFWGVWLRQAPQRPKLDPETIARFENAERDYQASRAALTTTLDSLRAAGAAPVHPVASESLQMLRDAIAELRTAIAKDPDNPDLRELLLRTYRRELDLLRTLAELPAGA